MKKMSKKPQESSVGASATGLRQKSRGSSRNGRPKISGAVIFDEDKESVAHFGAGLILTESDDGNNLGSNRVLLKKGKKTSMGTEEKLLIDNDLEREEEEFKLSQ
jgi:hypothetical protein